MFSERREVKIIDFGMSKVLAPGEYTQIGCGSVAFSAPEVLQCLPYDQKADIWSLGMILHFMLTRQLPFVKENTDNTVQAVVHTPYKSDFVEWKNISKVAKDLVDSILQHKDARQRPTISQVLASKWL